MTSVVEICNLALSNIRAGSINSLDEPSVQAQQCKLKYPILRDRLLTEIPWSFNRIIRPLSLLTVDIFNWSYAYNYPNDCLKINRLIGEHEQLSNASSSVVSRLLDSQLLPLKDLRSQIPYEIFNANGVKVIATNESSLHIDCSSKITDPNLFSNDFILAFSHLFSSELAVPLISGEIGRKLRSDSLAIYEKYLSSAIADDMNEQYNTPALSEYETIRR